MRFVIILLFLSNQTGFSGFDRIRCGARNSALGSASVAVAQDVWAVRANPGGIAGIDACSLGVDYEPDPFGISELRNFSAALAVPSVIGNIGVAAGTFGFTLYREVSVSLGFSERFQGVGFGARANVQSVSIARYGHASSLSFDAGVLIPLPPSFMVGLAFTNVGHSSIGPAGEELPQSFSLGASFAPMNEAAIFCTYVKEPGFDPALRIGVEYSFLHHAALRAGIDGEPALLCGGIGVQWSGIDVDYALSHHDDLGWTQEISINVGWGGDHE
jgi:hypothetical protein